MQEWWLHKQQLKEPLRGPWGYLSLLPCFIDANMLKKQECHPSISLCYRVFQELNVPEMKHLFAQVILLQLMKKGINHLK